MVESNAFGYLQRAGDLGSNTFFEGGPLLGNDSDVVAGVQQSPSSLQNIRPSVCPLFEQITTDSQSSNTAADDKDVLFHRRLRGRIFASFNHKFIGHSGQIEIGSKEFYYHVERFYVRRRMDRLGVDVFVLILPPFYAIWVYLD
jgi:hypothetical protein